MLAMNQGGPTDLVQQQIAQQQIDTIVEAMKRLGVVFPIASTCVPSTLPSSPFRVSFVPLTAPAGIYATKVREDWAATRQTLLSRVI